MRKRRMKKTERGGRSKVKYLGGDAIGGGVEGRRRGGINACVGGA